MTDRPEISGGEAFMLATGLIGIFVAGFEHDFLAAITINLGLVILLVLFDIRHRLPRR